MSKRFQSFDFQRKKLSEKNNYFYYDKQALPQTKKFYQNRNQTTSIYEKSFMNNKKNKNLEQNKYLPADVYELYSQKDKLEDIIKNIKTKQQLEIDQQIFFVKEKFMKIINEKKEKIENFIFEQWKNFDNQYEIFVNKVKDFLEDCETQFEQNNFVFNQEIQKLQSSDTYIQDPFKLQLNLVELQKKRIQNSELLLNRIKQEY